MCAFAFIHFTTLNFKIYVYYDLCSTSKKICHESINLQFIFAYFSFALMCNFVFFFFGIIVNRHNKFTRTKRNSK